MILSATLSKPAVCTTTLLGDDYRRIKIKLITASTREHADVQDRMYFAEFYTETQVFHKKMTVPELSTFLEIHAGKTFRACVERTDNEEITILSNKKGKITILRKPLNKGQNKFAEDSAEYDDRTHSLNRIKNYLLPEGTPVPFLIHLGVMTAEGKVITAKYDKFRQINRFLEYIDDILDDVQSNVHDRPLRVTDFGCGKSYLTFATYYYLTELRHLSVEVTGLDLKADVISYCNTLAAQFKCTNLHFAVGDISSFGQKNIPDIVITLHACDTATDYALAYAVKNNVPAILSVPCCQHELNQEFEKNRSEKKIPSDSPFSVLLKYGIIRERFAALATDALRAEYLETAGYSVQMLEFIDISHTPKNLLIRALKKQTSSTECTSAEKEAKLFTDALHISQALHEALTN
jgi:SAM-dependent methyltransferase